MTRNKPAAGKARPAVEPKPAVHPEIRPGQSIGLLKELHILTRDGQLNQDSRRKLKQVYHLYQFIEPLLDEVLAETGNLTLADHGAGKSYLGFILYDLFFKAKDVGTVFGIETRAELVERSRVLAEQLGFGRMCFLDVSVGPAALPLAAAVPRPSARQRTGDDPGVDRQHARGAP